MTACAGPHILAVLPGFIPSTMITVVKPLVNLHRAGRIRARIMLESQARCSDVGWADSIVFCRNTDPRYASLLAAAHSRGTPTIYDLDDNLFELPPGCAESSGLRDTSRQAMLDEYLRTAAMVRVYSQPLADRVAPLNPRVVRTFAPVDMSLVPPARDARRPGPIRIVYATSRTQDSLCEIFWPALVRIVERYAKRIEVDFWGCQLPRGGNLPGVRRHGLICQYDRYLRRFSRAGYDIGLAPLPDELFFRSKTNNKFREYGASSIAGIYSDNEVYAQCVQHEVSGLLVANDADRWYDALAQLIEDDALRTRIRQQARQYVAEHYSQANFEQVFLQQLQAVLHGPAKPTAAGKAEGLPRNATGLSGKFVSIGARARRSWGTLRRIGPAGAWTALKWFVSDRCLAARLRWQLGR
jgi:hypothetical protein